MDSTLASGISRTLNRQFGFSSFRPNQEKAVSAVLNGQDLFAAMPTGGGKSLCYQLPAALLPGITIVISPLIALMKDQVEAAREIGLEAEYLNSTLTAAQAAEIYARMGKGEIKLLYISPERFAVTGFGEFLQSFRISLFAVDEAHCLSEWGHDFRPDYLGLANIRKQFPGVPIAAFTATATGKVQTDIIRLLKLESPAIIRASFDRPEITYRIIPKSGGDKQILNLIQNRQGESGVIYRTSRKAVEKTASVLQKAGIRAIAYHAGLPPETREKNQDLFSKDEVEVIVATIAFGMGIDKSNIRFVIHGDLPRSMEGYYQESGRAGRDGEPSECLMLYSPGDSHKIRFFIDRMQDEKQQMRSYENLKQVLAFASRNVCRRRQILEYFDEKYPKENCGGCDVCNGESETEEATQSGRIFLSAVVRTGEKFGIQHLVDIVKGADNAKLKKFGHDKLPTWGAGKERHRNYWLAVAHELVGQNFLFRNEQQYNALQLTAEGRRLLKDELTFAITRFKDPAASTGKKSFPIDLPGDPELFDRLRKLRMVHASRKKIAPFIVFSDKTLREMSARKPLNEQEMLDVSGVGAKKFKEYGRDFLIAIREHEKGVKA